MEKLEDIGFYTLSNDRAKNAHANTPLQRCELILTSACNFRCPYCQPLPEEAQGTISFEQAMYTLNCWIKEGLENVRFSGGEPTLYNGLDKLVKHCKDHNVNKIAISTNGSNRLDFYKYLIDCGVNDMSISLDSGCCSIGDKMAGNIPGAWNRVVENIKEISKLIYVTVGMVFTEDNINKTIDNILFASSLGVSDIRIISAVQYNKNLQELEKIPKEILDKHPILKYRINHYLKSIPIRGISKKDCHKCPLVLDDIAVAQNKHYPCIIYMRQNGKPIGEVSENMRVERKEWFLSHNVYNDPICQGTCLDVCVDYNNKWKQFHSGYFEE